MSSILAKALKERANYFTNLHHRTHVTGFHLENFLKQFNLNDDLAFFS